MGQITNPPSGSVPVDTITKSSDETINNSAVLQDDDDFQWILTPGAYRFLFGIRYISGTTPDFKYQFGLPNADNELTGFAFVMTTGAAAGMVNINPAAEQAIGGLAANTPLIFDLVLNVVTGGTFVFKWAQNTQNASDTKVLAGSFAQKWTL